MFVKKLSINILTLYEMFYKGLRRGILIFYANTFKLLTSKHMRLQKGDSNMQFQLQFITDELPQTTRTVLFSFQFTDSIRHRYIFLRRRG